jgi:hypothetical protein
MSSGIGELAEPVVGEHLLIQQGEGQQVHWWL